MSIQTLHQNGYSQELYPAVDGRGIYMYTADHLTYVSLLREQLSKSDAQLASVTEHNSRLMKVIDSLIEDMRNR